MLKVELCLGLPIAALLVEVRLDRIPAEVPDHRRRTKTNLISLVLQTPTKVNIVPRSPPRANECRNEIGEPIRISYTIGVGKRNNLTGRGLAPHVPRRTQPFVLLVDEPHVLEALGDLSRAVRRTIVNDDNFII